MCTLHGPRCGRDRIFRLSPSKYSLWTLQSVRRVAWSCLNPPLSPRRVGVGARSGPSSGLAVAVARRGLLGVGHCGDLDSLQAHAP